jgi:hypothetical protein
MLASINNKALTHLKVKALLCWHNLPGLGKVILKRFAYTIGFKVVFKGRFKTCINRIVSEKITR